MSRVNPYTKDEIDTAKRLRASGIKWKQIASMYGGSGENWRDAVRRRDAKEKEQEDGSQKAYSFGAKARKLQLKKLPPYPYMTNLWSFWLAGWNDTDMALSHETQTNGAETQSAQGTDPLAA